MDEMYDLYDGSGKLLMTAEAATISRVTGLSIEDIEHCVEEYGRADTEDHAVFPFGERYVPLEITL